MHRSGVRLLHSHDEPSGIHTSTYLYGKVIISSKSLEERGNMQEPNEIEQMFIDAINTDVIDEMEESQLRALLTVLEKVK